MGIKKLFMSSALVVAILTATSVSAYASGEQKQITIQKNQTVKIDGTVYTLQVLEDGTEIRKVKITTDNDVVITSFNKKTGEIVTDSNGEITEFKFSPEKVNEEKKKDKITALADTKIGSAKDPIWGAYYKITKNSSGVYYWDCGNGERGTYLKQTSSNKGELNDFKGAMDGLVSKEAEFAAFAGTSLAAWYIAVKGTEGFSQAKAIATLTAIGMGLTAAKVGVEILACHANVELQFDDLI